jgi:hypothetical protein
MRKLKLDAESRGVETFAPALARLDAEFMLLPSRRGTCIEQCTISCTAET